MRKLLSACSLLGLVMAPAVQAQDAAAFKPTGAWTADYGEDYCRLIRTFSNGTDELSLALERLHPGQDVRMILVGKGLSPYRNAEQIGYQFAPSGATGKARYVKSSTADGKQFVSFDPVTLAPFGGMTPGAAPPAPPEPGQPFIPPAYDRAKELTAAQGINALALTEGLTSPVSVETGGLRAPIAAMQACADDLLKVWGLDPEKHKTMKAPAALIPDPKGVLPQGTIPFGDFGKLAGGANQVRILIGADGKPTACTIYSPALDQSQNDRICSLVMENAKFVPAKDAADQPMASYWMGSPMFLGPPFPGRRG